AAMAPEKGINALDAMILLFNAVGLMRQQLPSDVRMHGIITDGGKAPNVIPERSAARFLIRTLDADFRAALRKRFVAAVEGAASATGCSYTVRTVGNPYAPMRQNRAMRALIAEALDALGEPYEEGPTTDEPVSTDAGNVSEALPTAHPYFGVGEAAGACHMVEFARAAGAPEGLSAMRKAAVTLACVGARILTDERVRKELWEQFRLGE
ncbi:MAG: peptidase dimerization domain-containing protein, partial [Candidatus Methylomirabilis sp.]|nr:peptidase dimerization domain-containing protein [Deltaproteobacteria bacterium]